MVQLNRVPQPQPVRKVMTDAQRDQILEMILDSWIANPNQTSEFTRSESHRIAKKVFGRNYTQSNVIQVAGVRANYARGTYGDTSKLKTARKRKLKRLAS